MAFFSFHVSGTKELISLMCDLLHLILDSLFRAHCRRFTEQMEFGYTENFGCCQNVKFATFEITGRLKTIVYCIPYMIYIYTTYLMRC